MWKWYDSHIAKIENQSPTTKRFFLDIETEEPIQFKAGQFVTMDLPISDKRLKRWRSYSIANPPITEGVKRLEFSIVKADPSTGGSNFLFEEAEIGTPIRFKGPDGAFTLRTDLTQKDVVFICTGTGVAPFRSMLWDIFNRKMPHRNIHLIFGARFEKDILYRDEFEYFTQVIPNFKYDIALSREENWNGYKGYVHQIYAEAYQNVRPDIDFYICGWANMIDDAVAKLMVDMGYDRSQIIYELYG